MFVRIVIGISTKSQSMSFCYFVAFLSLINTPFGLNFRFKSKILRR